MHQTVGSWVRSRILSWGTPYNLREIVVEPVIPTMTMLTLKIGFDLASINAMSAKSSQTGNYISGLCMQVILIQSAFKLLLLCGNWLHFCNRMHLSKGTICIQTGVCKLPLGIPVGHLYSEDT